MNTGENEQGLRKILDMTRMISIVLLCLHCYYYCYRAFESWHWTTGLTDDLISNIIKTGLFNQFHTSKLMALGFLCISLIGAKGKKEEKLSYKTAWVYIISGLLFYFGGAIIRFTPVSIEPSALMYIGLTAIGYLMLLTGGTYLSRIIKSQFNNKDIFNTENESFPQEERLLENQYSINLPAQYHLKDKVRKSYINFINPFRAILILGSPGAGKSYYVVRHIIAQCIAKHFSMVLYDFKYDDLTIIAYNHYLKHRKKYPVEPKFYVINFDTIMHRCNPVNAQTMIELTDASESSRTTLLGLNREWLKKQGDFFVESSINFFTAILWFLRKYQDGIFLTIPHAIELIQMEYDQLFSILRSEKEIEVLINPFVSAYLNDAMEQLEGQIASAKIALARLSSPNLYYVLSGNDFTLDINNPEAPKILSLANNPEKVQTYGAVLSLYINRINKLINKKGKVPCVKVLDEAATLTITNIDNSIAVERSNKIANVLALQDLSQLRKEYGKDQADVIMNITGNIIAGQVTGDTAKQLSERFGKIMQDRSSMSINRTDTSISKSKQLESAVPASKIAGLSAGYFVGMVADNPDQRIDLKIFHNEILNDHAALKKEADGYEQVPKPKVTAQMIQMNYLEIKQEAENIRNAVLESMFNDPELTHLIVTKKK